MSIPWLIVVPAVVVLLALAWILYVSVRRRGIRRRLRDAGDPRADVAGAWRWARLLLAESWLPLPLSYAPAPDAAYPPDLPDDVQWHVVTLARLAGPALYGPGPVEPAVADEAWRAAGQPARAITVWEQHLAQQPRAHSVRLALVEMFNARGQHAQAKRWATTPAPTSAGGVLGEPPPLLPSSPSPPLPPSPLPLLPSPLSRCRVLTDSIGN